MSTLFKIVKTATVKRKQAVSAGEHMEKVKPWAPWKGNYCNHYGEQVLKHSNWQAETSYCVLKLINRISIQTTGQARWRTPIKILAIHEIVHSQVSQLGKAISQK